VGNILYEVKKLPMRVKAREIIGEKYYDSHAGIITTESVKIVTL